MPKQDETITFRCGAQLKKDLEKEAERQDLTLTQLLRRIIRKHLGAKDGRN
jgi:hypothetical protein